MNNNELDYYNKIKNWDFSKIKYETESLTNWDMYKIFEEAEMLPVFATT